MKLGYTVDQYSKKLNITIVSTGNGSKRLIELKWHSDRSVTYWYGFGVETEGLRLFDYDLLAPIVKLLQKLQKHLETNGNSPIDILNWLKGMKLRRAVYDGRLSNFVYLDELDDPNLQLWRDSENNDHVLAESENDAKLKLTKKIMNYDINAYDHWVRQGKGVMLVNNSYLKFDADTRPIEEIIEYPST